MSAEPPSSKEDNELIQRVCRGVASIQEGERLRAYIAGLQSALERSQHQITLLVGAGRIPLKRAICARHGQIVETGCPDCERALGRIPVETTATSSDPKRDAKLREVSQATVDAKLLGAGFLMIMPDNSFQRIDPEEISLKVRAPRCLAMINEFGDKVCSLRESHGGPHVWVTPVKASEPINQCDGCQRGLPVENGIHRGPGGFWSGDVQACTASRYASENGT